MESETFQEVFNIISAYLPKKWKKVALYFAFSGDMISHKFYVDVGNGYVDCFQMGYEKTVLRQIFFSIEEVLIEKRNCLPKEKQWSVFTMFVNSTGDFDANYGYDDISETFAEHQQNWEKMFIYKK